MKTSWSAKIVGILLPFRHRDFKSARQRDATWLQNPVDGNWNNPANWTAGSQPNDTFDTASFATSNETSVFLTTVTHVDGIIFQPAADTFTITMDSTLQLKIHAGGITNDSGTIRI